MPSPTKTGVNNHSRFANAALMGSFLVLSLVVFPLFPLYVLTRMCAGDSLACAARRGIWRYARTVMQCIAPFVPVQVNNPDMVRRHAPCVLVANHQSFLDLYLFGLQDESDLCMLTKTWPFRLLFFFAPAMYAAGYINVENADHEQTEREALQRLRDGATVIVFPEGRRSRDGQLGRFHAGAFRLAVKAGVPVVPLIIAGSGNVFPVGAGHFSPGPISMRFLPPLFPAAVADDPLPHRALLRKTQRLFQNCL